MAFGKRIRTYFEGRWHDGDIPVMRAADHGSWQGSSVFDGARWFDGVAPDLDRHCARVNRSAEALMITPTVDPGDMMAIIMDGLRGFPADAAVYLRPMYWAIDGTELGWSRCATRPALPSASNPCRCRPRGIDHPVPHPFPPPGAGGCGMQCQGGMPLSQQCAHAGRGEIQGFRQCTGGRCDGKRGRDGHRQYLHGQGWRGDDAHPQRHLSGGHYPCPPHCQPARGGGWRWWKPC